MGGLNMNKGKSVPITKRQVYDGYKRVLRNAGSAGIDGMSLEALKSDYQNLLYKLWNRLSSGSYFPPPVKRVLIRKDKDRYRPLGIPTVMDRVSQAVVKEYCEPKLEAIFSDHSYGYRPGRNAHQALERCRKNCWQYAWVIDIDIKGYFDHIRHDLLLKAVDRHFAEKWVKMYIKRWLEAGVLHDKGLLEKLDQGTPQGGVISPLLSNLFLHYVFDKWMEIHHRGIEFERYADDIIVHCRTEQETERLLKQIRERLLNCGLELNAEKTRIVYCANSKRKQKETKVNKFTFLGFDFKPRRKWNKRENVSFTGFDLGISQKAQKRIRHRIVSILSQLGPQTRLEEIADYLNARIRGWTNYFAKMDRYSIRGLWAWLNFRLIKWLMRNRKRFKHRIHASVKWLKLRSKLDPKLFAHWQFGCTP
jgi:group II intron reverse transcriptase/maturase